MFLFSFSGGGLLLISRRRRSAAAAAAESACRGSERVLVVVVVQVAFLELGVEGGAGRQAGRQQTLVVERTNERTRSVLFLVIHMFVSSQCVSVQR